MNVIVFTVSIASIVGLYLLVAWAMSQQNKNKCGLKCMNDSVPDKDCTSCLCKNKWEGADCNICQSYCKNGGLMTPSCDICSCNGGWRGDQCEICGGKGCGANQEINDTCTGCKCVGGWAGQDCLTCPLTCNPPQQPSGDCTICVDQV